MEPTLTDTFAKLRKALQFECGSGASEEEVSQAEAILKVTFPEAYRQFLRCFGYAEWDGSFIAGVDPEGLYSVTEYTQEERELGKKYGSRMPPHAVVISTDIILLCPPSDDAGIVRSIGGVTAAEKFRWPSFAHYVQWRLGL